jgi:alkyl sulfatase BDS1-like metallo-beta-lactamase superfamily hydrolase
VTVDLVVTDTDERYRLQLRNGVLSYTTAPQATPADAVVTLPAAALPALALGRPAPGVEVAGGESALGRLLGALDPPDPDFAIVLP